MRIFWSFFIIIILPCTAVAQQFHGRVYDDVSNQPIATVLITNTHSGALWVSDSSGGLAFTAYPGDIITFQHPAYRSYSIKIASYKDVITIGLSKAPVELAGVEVISPLFKLQQEAEFNRKFFKKELEYAGSRPGLSVGGGSAGAGVGMTGLFSELALSVSGKKKAYRRFADEMVFLEELRYSGIRYTPTLVSAQTGLDDSAAAAFIIRHPIPADFVRAASELELKMWVRERYRAQVAADSPKR